MLVAAARDPLDALRERLGEIDEQMVRLGRTHRRGGDHLAGPATDYASAGILVKVGTAASK